MLLNDKQMEEFVKRHREMYGDTSKETGTGKIATVYSDNPEDTEELHRQMWLDKITELLWKNANKKYTHRWGRIEPFASAACSSLWLYCWPTFKHNNEKWN